MTLHDYSVDYYESSLNDGSLVNCFIENLFEEEEGPFGEADCAGL